MKKSVLYIFSAFLLASCQHEQPATTAPVTNPQKETVVVVRQDDKTVARRDQAVICPKMGRSEENSDTKRKKFKAAVNDTLSLGDAKLCVPAEGLEKEMVLSITPLDSASLPQVPAGLANVTTRGGGYRFLPHGEHFKRFAKVVIPFDSVRIPKGYTAKDIRTYYYDEQAQKWTVLPKDSIDEAKQVASALTTHFTDMINGIITVPETPEAQGYAPTTISDIKAGDPSAGIMAVQAPQPNNNGTVSLQIPFNFPKGRAGMGPNVNVTYSSEGGSSWCGYGWSVNTPCITIDTRWGVPRYSTQTETESYLFNGEQFTDRTYRGDFAGKPREADKRFYLRREADFAEIVRKGDAPTNYYWEVRHLNGVVDIYNAEEQDEKGNIAKWCLAKTTDAHGNCVTYEYENADKTAYIKSINYTGFGGQKGAYTLRFNRNGDRLDFTSSGRNGVLQFDKQQLTSIDVLLDDKVFRSYKFEYATGRFGKTLLMAVAETDDQGNELYRNSFRYKDPLKTSDMFGETVELKTEYTPGNSKMRGTKDYSNEFRMLGGSSSSGFSGGGGMNVGFGTMAFAGGGFNYTKNESYGNVEFIDIDGDNLPDKVYTMGSQVKYQKALITGDQTLSFSEKRAIKGINKLTYTVTETRSPSEDVGVGYWGVTAGATFTQAHESSKTKIYSYDFNSDGLVDFAVNGVVYFNHLEDGKPVFESHSKNTPNPMQGANVLWSYGLIADTASARKKLEQEFPLVDAVRTWRAPFAGSVTYEAPVSVGDASKDGVRYMVQLNSKKLHKGKLSAGGSAAIKGTQKVKKGDRLYFRLQSNYSGTGDECEWSPVIKYDSVDVPLTNENGIDYKAYSADGDFIAGNSGIAGYSKPCKLRICGPLRKGVLSEDVRLTVAKITATDTTYLVDRTLPATEEVEEEVTFDDELKAGEAAYYKFALLNSTQIDHGKLDWQPMIVRTNQLGYTDTLYFSPQRTMFNKVCKLSGPYTLPDFTDTVNTYTSDSIRLVADLKGLMYTNGEKSTHAYLKIAGGAKVDTADLNTENLGGKDVFASIVSASEIADCGTPTMELHRTKIDSVFNKKDSVWERVNVDTLVAKLPVSVYSVYDNQQYGHGFKGWGAFACNGNSPDSVINPANVTIDQKKYESQSADGEAAKVGKNYNTNTFYLLNYDSRNQRYTAGFGDIYIGRRNASSSRYANPEIEIDVLDLPKDNHAMVAPYIMSETETSSNNEKLGLTCAGVGGGTSSSNTKNTFGVLDVNGDRYPDWITTTDNLFSAYYTDGLGKVNYFPAKAGIFQETSQSGNAYSINSYVSIPFEKSGGEVEAKTEVNSVWQALLNASQAAKENKQSGASVGASGNFCENDSYADHEWSDLNGDGLPDFVYTNNGHGVWYNKGYQFELSAPKNLVHMATGSHSSSNGAGLSASVTICGRASIGGGYNYTSTTTEHKYYMMDMNGDGIPDVVNNKDKSVEFRSGDGYFDKQSVGKAVGENFSTSEGYSINVGAVIPVWLITLTPHGEFTSSNSVGNTSSSYVDVNGDGLPDMVSCHASDKISVRFNMLGGTNLLDSVITPMGAKIALSYGRTLNSYEMPHSKYVLTAVDVIGGNPENGATRCRSEFEYAGGYYDRYEREFYGFETVTAKEMDTNTDQVYRTTVSTYENTTFANHGLLKELYVEDNSGDVLSSSRNTYKETETACKGSVFQALVKKEANFWTGGEYVKTTETFTYDEVGNVTAYTSTAGDVVDVKVRYCDKPYLRLIPVKVNVSGGATRERACTVNDKGDITQITLANGDHPSVYDFEHDAYGNITQVTRPKNGQGQRLWNKFVYDGVTHSLVTEVSNAYGYHSSSEYDLRFSVPVKTTDINGQTIDYSYDDFGRLTKVRSPYDADYTIKMEYAGNKATTYNHTQEGDIVTVTTCDNLMRPVRVEKTAVVDGKPGKVATGVVTFDAFGRVVREYLPTLDGGVSAGYSQTSYDAHDRKTEVVAPDGSTTKMAYEVVDGGIKTTVTDPENHVAEQYADARGRTVKTVRKGGSEDITVEYRFNPLGELLAVTHPNGLQTKYTYDQLGNKLSVDNPDAGLTRFTYDAVGNLTSKTTPNLAQIADGGYIKYVYDYERLSEVQYPVNVTNRIQYTYGESGDKNNCAGRIKLVQDASGGTEFAYGKLGEVTKTIRSVMLSTSDVRTYVFEFSYDSWNRIRQMKYPDGEVLTYGYDAAGQLISMVSKKDNTRYTLLEDMRYDQYGNVTYKKYGNGTESNYTYDPKRQHLTSMVATNSQGEFINAAYSYDKVDNILGIRNTAKPLSTIGGTYSHSYTYDDFSRLVSASGKCGKGVSYQLNMEYDIMSNPLRKKQTVKGSAVATSHDLEFTYDGDKPNAASKIGNESYTYDLNGNPTLIEGDTTYREMVWNEENRLMILSDADYVSRYTYDYTGNRVIKSHGPMTTIYINSVLQGVDMHDDENYTLYVSPYMTVNADRFTKYYYAGTQRIASKLGSGKFDNVYGVNGFHLTAGGKDYAERSVQMVKGVQDYYRQAGVTPGVPNEQGQHANPYISGTAYPSVPLGNYDVPTGWPGPVARRQQGQVFGPPVSFLREAPQEAKAGVGFKSDHQREGNLFYFHTDHLGSTSYLTDTAGNVSQFVWYAPYGESLVDEHTTTYENPFKFSGKELDDITGLYDHGARNRNPITAVWYGIDELFEKYPENGPYGYCGGNPVRYFDPDGRDVYYNRKGEYLGSDEDGYKGYIYISKGGVLSPDLCKPLQEAGLTAEAYSNIYTDILSKKGVDINGLYNNKISVLGNLLYMDQYNMLDIDFLSVYNCPWKNVRFLSTSLKEKNGIKISVNQNSPDTRRYLTTVENVYNSIGIHEHDGHGILKYGDPSKNHYLAYELQISDPSWKNCTLDYKIGILKNYLKYRYSEIGPDEKYKTLYETWMFYKDLQENIKNERK